MDQKLTPLQMVAREMADHSSLSPEQIEDSVKRVLRDLRKRAADEITRDDTSEDALTRAHEYQTISELVNFFGSQLIAFEDLDVFDADRIKN